MIFNFLNSRFFLVFFSPFILGAFTVFSFQPFNYSYINFFIIPTLFLITTYVKKKSKNTYRKKPYLLNLFLIGYIFGVGFFLSGTYWISHSLTFDENFKFLIPISLIGLPLFLGFFFGLGNLIVGPFLKNNFVSILLFSSSLALMDFLRSTVFTGFPWNLWAYTWSWTPETFQLLPILGFFSFNLFCIIIFCSPLLLIFQKRFSYRIFFLIVIIFFGNYIYGSSIIKKNNENLKSLELNTQNSIFTKVISPSFDLKYNLSNDDITENISKLIRYSAPEKDRKTLFVWPEGVFTGYNFSQITQYKSMIEKAFSENHLILFGVNTSDINQSNNLVFNSLIIINNKFDVLFKYNKIKLVPFGEFMPFEKISNKLGLKKITDGYGSFTKGDKTKIFILDKLKLLPLICYEIIFPELSLNHKQKNLIVNISEDAWFGKTIGPDQHLAKAIFRAVENNVFLVRSANKGFSAFIDNKGVVKKVLGPEEVGIIELKVPFINNKQIIYKNNLIFFILLITCAFIFIVFNKNENK
ncbi:apolipoprotein N-acyltransferase [Pelagibacteraceae bacterium]|nr:apolipoprotein N-acyltransferase [Pelagibacteraceae bacterium]|tara:strand:- start:987 stop:2561 length:1575 start_codon:yes stop_codon:yes gene_type:complete